ncbi:MAG: hypothetical protein MRZ79_07050 [Bacteroidia bacterium]|nr:hypothetical protein [Bacteroidia bacterium]
MDNKEEDYWELLHRGIKGETEAEDEGKIRKLLEEDSAREELNMLLALEDGENLHKQSEIDRFRKLDRHQAKRFKLQRRAWLIAAAVIGLLIASYFLLQNQNRTPLNSTLADLSSESVKDSTAESETKEKMVLSESIKKQDEKQPNKQKIIPRKLVKNKKSPPVQPKSSKFQRQELVSYLATSQMRYSMVYQATRGNNYMGDDSEEKLKKLKWSQLESWAKTPGKDSKREIQDFLGQADQKNKFDSLQAGLYLGVNYLVEGKNEKALEYFRKLDKSIPFLAFDTYSNDVKWWLAIALIANDEEKEASALLTKLSNRSNVKELKPAIEDLLLKIAPKDD